MRTLTINRCIAALLAALMAAACGGDDAAPAPPPAAELELLRPGTTSGTPPCVDRGEDPRQSITVELAVRNFALRPPLTCNIAECGLVLLTLSQGEQDRQVRTSLRVTSVPTVDFADGPVTIQAQLLDTFGEAYSTEDVSVVCEDCERTFRLQSEACDGSSPGDDEPEPQPSPDAGSLLDAGANINDAGIHDGGIEGSDAGARASDAGGRDASSPIESDASMDLPSTTDAGPDAGTPQVEFDAGRVPSVADASTDSGAHSPDASLPDAG